MQPQADDAALLTRLFDAVEAADIPTFLASCAEDAVVWHNHSLAAESIAQTAQNLSALHRVVRDVRYEDRKYVAVPGGAYAQHILRGTTITGHPVELPLMLRAYIEGGKIVRMEEYTDTAQGRPIVEAFAAA